MESDKWSAIDKIYYIFKFGGGERNKDHCITDEVYLKNAASPGALYST